MGATPSQFKQWARPKQALEGVQVKTEGDIVNLDIYVILKNDVNLRQVSRTIQDDVARALTEMVGMQAGQINIHIEDIDFPSND